MFKQGDIIKYGDVMRVTIADDFGREYLLRASNGTITKAEKYMVNAVSMLMTDFVKKNRPLINKIATECYTYIARNCNINLPMFVKTDIKDIVEAYFTNNYKKAEKCNLYIKNRTMYHSALNWIKQSYPC